MVKHHLQKSLFCFFPTCNTRVTACLLEAHTYTHKYTHDQCFAFMTTQTVNDLRNHNYIATFLPDGTFPVLPSCMREPSLRCILPSALMPIFLFLGYLFLKGIDGEDRKPIVLNKITETHRVCNIYKHSYYREFKMVR